MLKGIKVPTACEPLILLLFTIPENEPGNQRFLRNLFRFMDRDAEGIEFAIKVPATRKPLLLILRTRFVRSGEFAIVVPATQKRLLLLLRIHYVRSGEFAIPCPGVDATGKMPYAFGACSIRLLSCGDVVDHARGYVRFFLDDYSSGRDVGGQGQRYRVVGRR